MKALACLAALALVIGCGRQKKQDCHALVNSFGSINEATSRTPSTSADVDALVKDLSGAKVAVDSLRSRVKTPAALAGLTQLSQSITERIELLPKLYVGPTVPPAPADSVPLQLALQQIEDGMLRELNRRETMDPAMASRLRENGQAIDAARGAALKVCDK